MKLRTKYQLLRSNEKETNYDAKILEIEGTQITTADYNDFMSEILDPKIKQKKLVNKYDISNLLKTSDLNTKQATFSVKA